MPDPLNKTFDLYPTLPWVDVRFVAELPEVTGLSGMLSFISNFMSAVVNELLMLEKELHVKVVSEGSEPVFFITNDAGVYMQWNSVTVEFRNRAYAQAFITALAAKGYTNWHKSTHIYQK